MPNQYQPSSGDVPSSGGDVPSSDRGSVQTTADLAAPSGPPDHTSRGGVGPAGRPVLLWAAAASLGLLFLQSSGVLGTGLLGGTRVTGSDLAAQFDSVTWYLPLLAPLLALLAWQWQPRRAPVWLLAAGVVAALPATLLTVAPEMFSDWMGEPLMVLTTAAPSFSLVGILGAATVGWHAGRRAPAAVLMGSALVVQLVGPLVMLAFDPLGRLVGLGYRTPLVTALTVIFLVLALAGVVAVFAWSQRSAATDVSVPRPTTRVTAAACVAVLAQLLPVWWRPEPFVRDPGEIADYLLYLGLVYLAIGLLVAAVGGNRILIAAGSIGLLVGTFSTLLAPAVEVLEEAPEWSVVGAIVALGLSAWAAMSPYRAQIGLIGLAAVVVGLLVIFLYSNSDQPYSEYEGITNTITGILLVVGIVAAVCAVATVGTELAERSDVPAVLAGLGAPFSLGITAVVGSRMLDHPVGKAPIVGLLIPVMVGLAVAIALLAALFAASRSGGVAAEDQRM